MASFGWKRKVGEKVSKAVVQQFVAEAEKAEHNRPGHDEEEEEEEVDWLQAIKRRREILKEDCSAKSKRLKDEGALLAEEGRWGMGICQPIHQTDFIYTALFKQTQCQTKCFTFFTKCCSLLNLLMDWHRLT